MELAVQKFAHEIITDVLVRHQSRQAPIILAAQNSLAYVPSLYNQRCKHIVNYYFNHYNESLTKYYLKECANFNEDTFIDIANKLIRNSSRHSQSSEVFYRLCIQLALLGAIAFKEGCHEGVPLAIKEIVPLASKAYLRCDLDEKYDCMFNFSLDVLNVVFNWAEQEINLDKDLRRLELDSGSVNYFALYKSYFMFNFEREGKSILNRFKAVGSSTRNMTREAFIFRIQDFCDDYYRQLGQSNLVQLRQTFLDISIYISLLTLHASEVLYPSDLRLAHEVILRLAIISARYGIINSGRRMQFEKTEVINIL